MDVRLAERTDERVFLAHLHTDPETMHIPTIITAGQMGMLPRQGVLLRTTACHVMAKPLDARELLRAIETALAPSPAAQSFGAYVHATSHADPSVVETLDDPRAVAAGAAV